MERQTVESSDALLEYMYSAIQAGKKYIDNPTDENFTLAELAREKARFAEHKTNILSKQDAYTNVPMKLQNAFVSAVNTFLENPSDETRAIVEAW